MDDAAYHPLLNSDLVDDLVLTVNVLAVEPAAHSQDNAMAAGVESLLDVRRTYFDVGRYRRLLEIFNSRGWLIFFHW